MVTTPFPKKKLLTTEKVTTSEEVDKGTTNLDDTKETVVTIHRKDLDNFEGKSKVPTGWFNIYHEFLKRKSSTLEPDFYDFFYEKYIEDQHTEPYKKFLVPFDSIKLNLFMRKYSLKNKEKNISSDDEEATTDSESSSDKGEKEKDKFWHQFKKKNHHLNNLSRYKRQPMNQI